MEERKKMYIILNYKTKTLQATAETFKQALKCKKEFEKTDKELQRTYNWQESPQYEIRYIDKDFLNAVRKWVD